MTRPSTGGDPTTDVGDAGSAWTTLAAAMTDRLVRDGHLNDPAWIAVMRAVPRHAFVPGQPMPEAYQPISVITQTRPVGELPGAARPTSSLSAPSAVAVPLERLDVRPGHRILEIGTGTGYVAALLAHRLGPDSVFSVELDPELSDTARNTLDHLGLHPHLAVGDGARGLPAYGPYDRILATCAVTHLPPAWIEQLVPGGRIVAPLAGNRAQPYLVAERTDAVPGGGHAAVRGWFDRESTGFMPLRHHVASPLGPDESAGFTGRAMPAYATTDIDPAPIREAGPMLALWCRLHVPGLQIAIIAATDDHPARTIAHASDSYAEVGDTPDHHGRHPVLQRGPRRVWDSLETALRLWEHLDHPEIDRFGLHATTDPDDQFVWLDDPLGPYSWPLPR